MDYQEADKGNLKQIEREAAEVLEAKRFHKGISGTVTLKSNTFLQSRLIEVRRLD